MACDCMDQLNDQMAAYNTQIGWMLNLRTGDASVRIATTKIETKKRLGPKTIEAKFCPFCGVRYIALDAPTDTTPTMPKDDGPDCIPGCLDADGRIITKED